MREKLSISMTSRAWFYMRKNAIIPFYRMQDLQAIIREERDQRRNDIEHLATSLVCKVNECVAALDEGE